MPRKKNDPPPIHAGEILAESFLEPSGLTQAKFAAAVGVTPAYVCDIINGRRGISAEMALRFEAALGMPAQFWLNAQNAVDLYHARNNKAEREKRKKIVHLVLAST